MILCIYEGFHLVETYHKMRHQRKYHPEDSTKRVIKIALVALVTLLLSYHRYLCLCYADVDSRNRFFLGHVGGYYSAYATILYGQRYIANGQ